MRAESPSQAGFLVEAIHMGGVRVGEGQEAEAFVKAGGGGIIGAQADTFELAAGMVEQPRDHGGAESLIAPRRAYEDAANTADFRPVEKRIAVEAADGGQQAVVDRSAQRFAGTGEAILAADPLNNQRLDEWVAFLEGFGAEGRVVVREEIDFVNRRHGLRIAWRGKTTSRAPHRTGG